MAWPPSISPTISHGCVYQAGTAPESTRLASLHQPSESRLSTSKQNRADALMGSPGPKPPCVSISPTRRGLAPPVRLSSTRIDYAPQGFWCEPDDDLACADTQRAWRAPGSSPGPSNSARLFAMTGADPVRGLALDARLPWVLANALAGLALPCPLASPCALATGIRPHPMSAISAKPVAIRWPIMELCCLFMSPVPLVTSCLQRIANLVSPLARSDGNINEAHRGMSGFDEAQCKCKRRIVLYFI